MRRHRDVLLVLLGIAGLALKRHFGGPLHEVIQSYGGNISVSFAVYFLLKYLPLHTRFKAFLTAGLALIVVELFEACDGFGVMENVYDPFDFVANFAGIALALSVDAALGRSVRASTSG
jgi:hypothetical protein